MLHLSLNNPYESSLIFQDLSEISETILNDLKPLIKLEKNLRLSAVNLGESLKELESADDLAESAELKARISKMAGTGRQILARIESAQKSTADLLVPARTFAKMVEKRVLQLDRELVSSGSTSSRIPRHRFSIPSCGDTSPRCFTAGVNTCPGWWRCGCPWQTGARLPARSFYWPWAG